MKTESRVKVFDESNKRDQTPSLSSSPTIAAREAVYQVETILSKVKKNKTKRNSNKKRKNKKKEMENEGKSSLIVGKPIKTLASPRFIVSVLISASLKG